MASRANAANTHAPKATRAKAAHARGTPAKPQAAGGVSAARGSVKARPPVRVAAIDVGSNAVRLRIAEVLDEGGVRVVADKRQTTRLGQRLSSTGRLPDDAIAQSVEAIASYSAVCEEFGVRRARAVATAAVREAGNGAEFLDAVRRRCGRELEIITADEEARIALRSIRSAFDLDGKRVAAVDIGGGSVQVVMSVDGVIVDLCSMPLGAVRLTEMFASAGNFREERFQELRRYVQRVIDQNLGEPAFTPELVVGTGGTFSTASGLLRPARARAVPARGSDGASRAPVPGAEPQRMRRAQLSRLLERLRVMSHTARAHVKGMPADRADIIVPGLVVVERLLRHLGAERAAAHEGGIRHGIVLLLADEVRAERERPARPAPARAGARSEGDALVDAARELALRCGSPREHVLHVAAQALRLYDALGQSESTRVAMERHGALGEGARELLHAAALLHDSGVLVEYRAHHKHSASIIRHATLPGLDARRADVLACVARYHRRAMPSPRHPEFAALAHEDKLLVQCLAAILRVADGLDHDHSQRVRVAGVAASRAPERRILRVRVRSRGDAAENIDAAESKGDLFAEVFDLEPVVEVG